jgi:hypothetical protein
MKIEGTEGNQPWSYFGFSVRLTMENHNFYLVNQP